MLLGFGSNVEDIYSYRSIKDWLVIKKSDSLNANYPSKLYKILLYEKLFLILQLQFYKELLGFI